MDSSVSWEELGEAGERKVRAAIPKGFDYFRNIHIPCCHGYGSEEIDLVVTGRTGIWSIEIKNWRGIARLGDYPEEVVFIRNTSRGERTSFRDNPYKQARRHTEDLYQYLAQTLKSWFPTINTLVVFATRDKNGVNGVNLNNIRYYNPSIIYLDELQKYICRPGLPVRWDKWHLVADILSNLPTRTPSYRGIESSQQCHA